MMTRVYSSTKPSDHENKFRVSSMPYCPILFLEGDVGEKEDDFSMSFYTEAGTAHHENLQTYFPQVRGSNILWGNWRCRHGKPCSCPTNHKGETHHSCGKTWQACNHPGRCKCGRIPKYEEIEVEYKNGLTGHIDTILRSKSLDIIIDYKTCGLDYITVPWMKKYLPYDSNVIQIENYCALIEVKYGWRPDGWALVYVSRERPKEKQTEKPLFHIVEREWTVKRRDLVMKRLNRACKTHGYVLDAIKKPTSELVKTIIDRRPCKSEESYESKMGAKFKFEDCEHQEICTGCQTKKIEGRVKWLLKNRKDKK